MKVSVVVPSYNQGRFLKATLDSILDQDHPDIEVLVFDGGSTDESVDVLKSYGDRIFWVSRKDRGQTDAINQGLGRATGEILAYLNSDDIYYPGTVSEVVKHFAAHPDSEVVYGDADYIREDGSYMDRYATEDWSFDNLIDRCFICQPSVFWRRRVMEVHGLFDDTLHFGMDYEYWLRVGKHVAFDRLPGGPFAASRMYADNKTMSQRVKVMREALKVTLRHANRPPYVWLGHMCQVDAETAHPKHLENAFERKKFILRFVHAHYRFADEYGLTLPPEIVARLDDWLTEKGF